MKLIIAILILSLLSSFSSCNKDAQVQKKAEDGKEIGISKSEAEQKLTSAKSISVRVFDKIPHDKEAYTQGLFYHDGFLYESTGQRGFSSLRKIDPKNGEIIKKTDVPSEYFSEGISLHNDKIFMITWTSGKCFVYDPETFEMTEEMNYQGQGWGLTNYGDRLLMSDGSNILRIIDPKDFTIESNISIVDENYNPIGYLNELEYIEGNVWANIWMKDKIAVIDIENQKLRYWVDISHLRSGFIRNPQQEVANGIAYNKKDNMIYLTGKYWEYIFLVKLPE